METYTSISKKIYDLGNPEITVKKGFFGTSIVHQPTGKKLKSATLYISPEDALLIEKNYEKTDAAFWQRIKKRDLSGCELNCYFAEGTDMAVLQVSRYVPYTYVPTTPIVVLKDVVAVAFVNFAKA
jgi:hypothetical protein